jgi:hypothetical protein
MLVRMEMQLPVLKDGIVVNVIEIGEDTQIVTKARCKELIAIEDAEYAERIAAWREAVGELRKAHEDAAGALGMARMTVAAVKERARKVTGEAGAQEALRQILALEGDVTAHERKLAEIAARPMPEKPRLVRGKRWFHSDGLEVGPAGGNIGDRWDGVAYVRPDDGADKGEERGKAERGAA